MNVVIENGKGFRAGGLRNPALPDSVERTAYFVKPGFPAKLGFNEVTPAN